MKRDNHNNDRDYDYDHEHGKKLIALVVSASSFLVLCLFYSIYVAIIIPSSHHGEATKPGKVDVQQYDLIVDDGFELVVQNCTGCHSGKIIAENRADRKGWLATIRWMQQTQKLWKLGENEYAIVNYLAKNYGPVKKGRRAQLTGIEWYELEEND